ncbi:MAG: TIGR02221 family CRISPR-associated protein [Campylobacteraceae bacterium]|jgi:CRISPR-associated Csx2 family protein|nr:TIGR02221 family CRISPR-associated protein [Campylobacteraceae bacterium]
MAKILISLVGTGKIINDGESKSYKRTDYSLNDKLYNESFVANAIIKHYQINKLFFIGTNVSMWDEIGNTFDVDDNICTLCYEKQNSKSLAEDDLIPLAEAIDRKLGQKGSKCIIIKEGCDNDELWETFERFIEILDTIDDSDELYLDITHLFRSISVMALVMSEFGLSYKRFKIKGVFYGQLNSEKSPIIDLSVFFEFLEYSKAIRDLKLYGNGHSLNELLKNSNESKEIKDSFEDFSCALSVADMGAMQQSIKNIKGQIKTFGESKNPIIKIISKQLFPFIKRFDTNASLSKFQFTLAEWYAENSNYAMAYITLVEAIISVKCEAEKKDSENKNNRKEVKKELFDNPIYKASFTEVDKIRNNIAHKISTNSTNKYPKSSPKKSISDFKKYLSYFKRIG